jgi:ubiquitin-protein ligase
MQAQANNKRKEKDVMKLMMSNKYDVELLNDNNMHDFEVVFKGPQESYYEGVSTALPNSAISISIIIATHFDQNLFFY